MVDKWVPDFLIIWKYCLYWGEFGLQANTEIAPMLMIWSKAVRTHRHQSVLAIGWDKKIQEKDLIILANTKEASASQEFIGSFIVHTFARLSRPIYLPRRLVQGRESAPPGLYTGTASALTVMVLRHSSSSYSCLPIWSIPRSPVPKHNGWRSKYYYKYLYCNRPGILHGSLADLSLILLNKRELMKNTGEVSDVGVL